MMEGAVIKLQQTRNEMKGAAEKITENLEVKDGDHIVDVADEVEPTESFQFSPQVLEGMTKVREAMNPINLYHIVDFGKPVSKHKLTHGVMFLASVDIDAQ